MIETRPDRPHHVVLDADVAPESHHVATTSTHGITGPLRRLEIAAEDAGAGGGQGTGGGGADAARDPGDKRHLSVETCAHPMKSPRSTLMACPVMFLAASDARKR